MRFVRPLILLVALVALALPATASAALVRGTTVVSAVKKTKLGVRVDSCGIGTAVFRGSMPARPALGSRMEMRFDLFTRGSSVRLWTPIEVENFGEWDIATPGVSGFIVHKEVTGLTNGNSYRAVVRFRWRDDNGVVRKTVRRLTRPCVQRQGKANLSLEMPRILTLLGTDAVLYQAVVRNVGNAATAAFNVALEVNGQLQPTQRIGPVGPGGTQLVGIQAPRCQSGSIVRFTVDASNEVAEKRENDNVLQRRCVSK